MSLLDDLLQPFSNIQTSQNSLFGPAGTPVSSVAPTGLQPQPQSQPQSQDTFSPTQISPHQAWQDRMLMLNGRHPVYQPLAAQHDMTAVMQNFDPDNPLPTIKRVAQIPGMGDQAYKMYEQYSKDQELGESRSTRNAAKKDIIYQRLGSMAGAATEKNFPVMQKLMTDYVKRWGENPDDYDIPKTYDQDALDALSAGGLTANQRAQEQTRQTALTLRQESIDNTDQYRQARLDQFNQGLKDTMDRFNKGLTIREENFNRNHQGGGVVTDQGVPGVVTPDGSKMMVLKNGVKYGYIRGGSSNGKINWVPVGPLAAPK